MFKTIIVATDGSVDGDRAVAQAREIAETAGSRVVVVHVTELVGGKGGTVPAAADEEELRSKIDSQVSEMSTAGVPVELVTRSIKLGGPAHTIAEEAEAAGADLIVVGSRGRSALTQIVLGSVPLRLLHIARCPVLIVPPAQS
jgi:nucleotide-binding universal stress UspA family protein